MKLRANKKIMKFIALTMTAALLAGCSSTGGDTGQTEEPAGEETKAFKIGISQMMDHKALNDSRLGFEERMQELGIEVEYDFKDAAGDISTAQLIAENFVADKVDLIYAIATPPAQTAQNATKNSKIPVVFNAVTDPQKAGLDDPSIVDNNVTGITNIATEENILELLSIAKELKNEKGAIGVIYSTSEVNAVSQVQRLEGLVGQVGLKLEQVPINGLTDIDNALEIVNQKADVLYIVNDNIVAASIALVAEKAKAMNLITVATDSSQVEGGALLSLGLSYKQLGKQAADMAKKILVDGVAPSEIPIEGSSQLFRFVNKTTADALGIDMTPFITDDTTVVE